MAQRLHGTTQYISSRPAIKRSTSFPVVTGLAMMCPRGVPLSIRLVVLMFLIVADAVAQNRMTIETHTELHEETGTADGGSFNPAPPVVLPETPAPRVIDKKFIAVMAALGGAESLRFTTRKLVLDNEFAAGAPWVTSVPTSQHLVAKYAGIYAAES